jgi:hypothetical protein
MGIKEEQERLDGKTNESTKSSAGSVALAWHLKVLVSFRLSGDFVYGILFQTHTYCSSLSSLARLLGQQHLSALLLINISFWRSFL